jgi:hypothetical protein
MTEPRTETQTPNSDVPPADGCDHPEGFEDGYFEDWDDGDDNGGYPDEEGW